MTDPARGTSSTTALDAARLAMLTWLTSPDALSAARSEVHRLGIDRYDPDDLLNDVAVRVLQTTTIPDNPIAYARRAVATLAIDLLRGELVRRRHDAPPLVLLHDDDAADGDDDPLRGLPNPTGNPADVAAAAAAEDAIRRALHLALAGAAKVWAVAAALTTMTLRVHPDVALPDDAPRPDAGDEGKADRWAALWLSGEVAVFADPAAGRPDTAALRQARSRKLREVGHLLQTIASTVIGGGDDA